MKIGIFTDTYRPSVNGIVYVTEILRRNFEAMGHEVYIFAPSSSLTGKDDPHDDHIIRFPAFSGFVYEESTVSLIFQPAALKQIKELDLDVIHFLTPGPVGLMGMYAAKKLDIALVAEYCTDLFQYAERYSSSLFAIAVLGLALPFTFKVSKDDLVTMLKAGRPRLGMARWNSEMVKHLMTVVHSHCDAVIVHSRKSADQLLSWQNGDRYPVDTIPTGVDPAPKPTTKQITDLKKHLGITPNDEVVMYLGRLGVEKNLDILIEMMPELLKRRPNAKLVFFGDFDYRETLEAKAAQSSAADRIVFAGKIPHEEIAQAFAIGNVFAFPSTTDTQSLTLHESALAGLPIVMIDELVTEVVKEGVNGYFCQNDPFDMAEKVVAILQDPELQKKMGAASRKLARKFTEQGQCKQIIDLYKKVVVYHANKPV